MTCKTHNHPIFQSHTQLTTHQTFKLPLPPSLLHLRLSTTMSNYIWIPLLLFHSLTQLTSTQSESTLLLPSESTPACPALNPDLNYRPVIGIISHPGDGASGRLNNDTNASYIAASYVKFVESAGARVIPFIFNEPSHILQQVHIHTLHTTKCSNIWLLRFSQFSF